MFLMQSGFLEQSLKKEKRRPRRQEKKKNCNKNNVLSGKRKCRNYVGLMLQVLNKVRNKLKRPKTI